jgi:glycosyltransferase involved in cell wall biosynthesis
MCSKITIVTPTFNSEKYLRETIDSVITQRGEFTIEYIIMDGGSSDSTKTIVYEYIYRLKESLVPINCMGVDLCFYSSSDDGMYDAINQGFLKATGNYYAWINSDDIYLPGAFSTVVSIFNNFSDISWLKGITSYLNNKSQIYKSGHNFIYSQKWIRQGVYGKYKYFIQQDSVFWRSDLWEKVGEINTSLKVAGDYYLWKEFSKYAPLVSVNAYLSCFRKIEGQLSSDFNRYKTEINSISERNYFLYFRIVLYDKFLCHTPPPVRGIIYNLLFGFQKYKIVKITNNKQLQQFSGSFNSMKKLTEH